jgi:ABC-type uncharacterized transport system ATPase subunit
VRTYDIQVEGDRERFLGAVAALGWPCSEDTRGSIRVQLPEDEQTRAIFQLARDTGVQLRHFHHKKDSLEDIFVSVIEEEERTARAGT